MAVLLLAATVRVLLFQRFPIFLTADSPDFLGAAEGIASEFDFFSGSFRDWRLPGYPIFLALVSWLVPWTSSWLVAVQKLLGLATTAAAMESGRRVAGLPGMLCLGLFVGLHPGYLLQEHMVMSESLFVFLLWVVVLCVFAVLERGPKASFGWGAALGLTVAATLLVRSNGVFVCLPVLAIVWAARVWRDLGDGPFGDGPFCEEAESRWAGTLRAVRRSLPFVAGAGLALAVVWGAWIVRNQIYLGTPKPFTDNTHRSRIVYLAQHDLLRTDLPEMAGYEFDPDEWSTAYDIMLHQLPEGEEERTARRIVAEQIGAQRSDYLREAWRGGVHFLGLPVSDLASGCSSMRGWFAHLLLQQPALEASNRSKLARSSLRFDRFGRQGRVLRAWKRAGLLYLDVGRAVVTLAFLASVALWLARLPARPGRPGRRRNTSNDVLVAAWSTGLGLVVIVHALLLADHDRYAVPFDGLFLLVAVAAVAASLGRAGGSETAP